MLLNGLDVIVDIGLGVSLRHILQQAFLVALSALAAALLILHVRKKTKVYIILPKICLMQINK